MIKYLSFALTVPMVCMVMACGGGTPDTEMPEAKAPETPAAPEAPAAETPEAPAAPDAPAADAPAAETPEAPAP